MQRYRDMHPPCSSGKSLWYYLGRCKKCLCRSKVFYQAVIHGERVTWMVPHRFTQYMPKDVDFRLMVHSWNSIRLQQICNVQIIPRAWTGVPTKTWRSSVGAGAIWTPCSRRLSKKWGRAAAQSEESLKDESEQQQASRARIATLPVSACKRSGRRKRRRCKWEQCQWWRYFSEFQQTKELQMIQRKESKRKENAKLFSSMCFFASREVPRESGSVYCFFWEYSGGMGNTARWMTSGHPLHIRPPKCTRNTQTVSTFSRSGSMIPSMPKWYCPLRDGRAQLPPHLSPFVNDHEEGYVPAYREELGKLVRQHRT